MSFSATSAGFTGANLSASQKLVTVKYNEQVNAGTAVIGTVGAGKKWTVVGLIACLTYGTAGTGTFTLEMSGATFAKSNVTQGNEVITMMFPYEAAPKMAATETFRVTNSAANCYSNITLLVVEENA